MSQERRQPASPRRRRAARQEGRVAFSAEPAGGLALLGLALLLVFGLANPVARLEALTTLLLGAMNDPEQALPPVFLAVGKTLGAVLLPWLLGLGGGGVLLGLIQTRGLITLDPLRPRLSRLSPGQGWSRLFSLDRLATPLRGLLLCGLALPGFTYLGLRLLPDLVRLPTRNDGALLIPELLAPVLWFGLGLTILSAAIDLCWRRHRHERSLRMTDQERREESRQEEGDPRARQERRGRHRQMALQTAPRLEEARAVVLNPTHIAVALHHDHLDGLPYLGESAAGPAAGRLRARARRAGLPLLRDRPLARALIQLEPGDEIPPALYAPVAALLASVYRSGLAAPPAEAVTSSPSPRSENQR